MLLDSVSDIPLINRVITEHASKAEGGSLTGFEQQQQLTVQQSLSRMAFLLKTSWAYQQSIGAALGTHTHTHENRIHHRGWGH